MRIAILSRNFSPASGGAERYSVSLAKELSKHHEIHVYCQESNFPVTGITYHKVLRIYKRLRWFNQWLFSLSTWLSTRNQFDIVHSHEHVWHGNVHTLHVRCVWASIFENRYRWKLVLRWLQVFTSLRHLTYLWLESARIRDETNRGLVFVSAKLRDEFAIHYSDLANRSIVITPGVSLPKSLRPRDECRRKLDWADDQIYLLFVANDFERKGLCTLLKALKELKSSTLLAVVGQSKQMTKFEMQVKQLGLTERVQFYDKQEDLSTFYRAADLLVHPTTEDSFGMVVLEAMSQELPVIVTMDEFMRRMKDMSKMGGGMGFYGNLPDNYNVAINGNHKLIGKILITQDEAEQTQLAKQAFDLALLSQGMLTGAELTEFVNRSVSLI
jgi:UDP-glucose:(heptosyl)LPS alpha-1,3-glucosyltransferase